jgi:ABC-type branched-subunit amino acid transport system substrate-binding protein
MKRVGNDGRGPGESSVLARKILRVAVLAVSVALVAALCAGCEKDTASTDSVVIGAIVSATGANSGLGSQERNVLEMMEGYINAAGGVLGRPVDIIIEDDESDPQKAVTAAKRLIEQENVVALIAATGSSSTVAVKAITAEKKLPQMAMVAANSITDEPPIDWVWRTPQKNAVAAARALMYVSETLGVTKIAVQDRRYRSYGATHEHQGRGTRGNDRLGHEPGGGVGGREYAAIGDGHPLHR